MNPMDFLVSSYWFIFGFGGLLKIVIDSFVTYVTQKITKTKLN